jgi:hypothetical protein
MWLGMDGSRVERPWNSPLKSVLNSVDQSSLENFEEIQKWTHGSFIQLHMLEVSKLKLVGFVYWLAEGETG